MKNEDIRWVQRFHNFNNAFSQLTQAVALSRQRPLSELEQQGLVKAFEFTHELAWNVLKDYLEAQGFVGIIGSKNATRQAFADGLIENGQVWMQMIEHRNQSSHTYDCETAEMIARAIAANYFSEFENFQKKFTELAKQES